MVITEFANLFDSFTDPVIVFSDSGAVYFNPAAERQLGKAMDFKIPENGSITVNVTEYDATVRTAFDHSVVFLSPSPIPTDSENLLFQVSSKLKSKIAELKLSADKIVLYTEINEDPQVAAFANTVAKTGAVLHRMIGNLGFFQNFDSKAFNPAAFDISQSFGDIVSSVPVFVGKRCPELKFICNIKEPVIFADKDKLELALYQLLSNSIKNTPAEGRITVSVSETDDNVSFSVADTGCGLSSNKLENLWNVGNTGYSPDDGFGVGLPIVKHIAQLHGGKALLTSSSNGTTVTVTISKKQSEADLLRSVSANYESGLSDLILQLSDVIPAENFCSKLMN